MRLHASFLVPIVLLLAGGLLLPAATPEQASAPTTELVPAMRHLEGPAYEPTLAITSAGNIFFSGGVPQNDPAYPGEAWVHGSYDNGATWVNTTKAIAANDAEIYDPFLNVDRDTGRLFRTMLQAQSVGGNGCMQLIWSDDEGATWKEDPMLCMPVPPFHDHESIAAGKPRGPFLPEGYPNFVYVCVNHAEGTVCGTSHDGAQSFATVSLVFPAIDARGWCGGLNSPVVTDSAGRVFVPRLHCDVPKVAVSEDGGLTWTQHTLPGPLTPRGPLLGLLPVEPQYIDLNVMHLAIDAADNLHVVYVAGDGLPYYLSSRDHGATWSSAQPVAAPGVTAVAGSLVAVGAGAEDHVAIAYLATDHPGGYSSGDWTGASWHMMLGVTTGDGAFAWTQLNPSDDPLGVDDCGVTRCQETSCPEGYCVGMYDYIDVDVAPDGRPWVAMVDMCHAQCALTGRHDLAQGAVGTLAAGPSLARPGEALAPLAWT